MKGKRLFSLLLALVLCVGVLPVVASAADSNVFDGGSGTFSDPYLISTKAQLNEVRNYLSSHFKLTANIAFQSSDFAKGGAYYNDGAYWIPIGDSSKPFTGTFDGNGKRISGLRQLITGTVADTKYYGGLFGYTQSACIQNLNLSATIEAKGKGYFRLGGIVGYARGIYTKIGYSLYNCTFSGSVTCNNDAITGGRYTKALVGGIVGGAATPNTNVADDIMTYISNCKNSATVQSNGGYVGGISGQYARIFNCSNSGSVTGGYYSGGIGGYCAIVYDSYNTGRITGTRAGGIDGFGSYISRCYNTGTITGDESAGGISGYSTDLRFRDCFNTGHISSKGYSGGLSGEGGYVERSYNVGTVTGGTAGSLWGKQTGSTSSNTYDDVYYIDSNELPVFGEPIITETDVNSERTDAEMRMQATFQGFDFDDVWTMDGVSTYPYPELRSVKMVTESLKTTAVVISGDTSCEIPAKDDVAQITLTATASLQNSYVSDTKNVTNSATWSVVNSPAGVSVSKGIVSIDSTAKAGGITIKAVYNGKSGTHVITLNPPSGPCAAGHDFSDNAEYCRNDCGTKNPNYVPPVRPPYKPVRPTSPSKPASTPALVKPEQPENPFTDIKKDDYFFDAVIWAVENGITSGTSATTFAPNKVCTRAEMVTFLWRAAGKPEPISSSNPFTDVNETDYFYKAVLWAVENGITMGTSATTFSPNDTCTRAQAATFLYRYAGSPEVIGANPFADVQETDYFYHAVIWAVDEEITKGTSATTFSPDNFCTRAQIVTFLYRYQQN